MFLNFKDLPTYRKVLGAKSSGRVKQCFSIMPVETILIYSYWTSHPRYWFNILFPNANRVWIASTFFLLPLFLLLLHIKNHLIILITNPVAVFLHYIIKSLQIVYGSSLIYLCKIAAFFTFVSFFMVFELNILFIGCSCAHHAYYFIMME